MWLDTACEINHHLTVHRLLKMAFHVEDYMKYLAERESKCEARRLDSTVTVVSHNNEARRPPT